jgi:hypothetical protein
VDDHPEHAGKPAGSKGADGIFSRRHACLVMDDPAARAQEAKEGSGDAATGIRHEPTFAVNGHAKRRERACGGWGCVVHNEEYALDRSEQL